MIDPDTGPDLLYCMSKGPLCYKLKYSNAFQWSKDLNYNKWHLTSDINSIVILVFLVHLVFAMKTSIFSIEFLFTYIHIKHGSRQINYLKLDRLHDMALEKLWY